MSSVLKARLRKAVVDGRFAGRPRWLRSTVETALGLSLALLAMVAAERLARSAAPNPAAQAPRGELARPAARADPDSPRPAGTAVSSAAVASYAMKASLDPSEHRVRGSATVRWTNRSALPQHELYWHLYLNAFESGDTIFFRSHKGPGFRGSGLPERWGSIELRRMFVRELGRDIWPEAEPHSPGEPADRTDIRVPLPRAVAPGEALTIELEWVSELPSLVLRTGFVRDFHMVAQWFPKLARLEPDGSWAHFALHRHSEFYADFGEYDVTVVTPVEMVVGATGELVSERRQGPSVERRFVARPVHDFAFAAWRGFRELDAQGPGGVRLRCLYPPGEERAARAELAASRAGLAELSRAYGGYPYPSLTIVHPPEWALEAGGMEYPTLITTGGRWLWRRLGIRWLEQVTAHELGHQWFYGLVATDEHRWPFLDEGLTTFVEAELLESWLPGASLASLGGFRVGLPAHRRALAADASRADIIAQPADEFANGADYGSLVYYRAASLLMTMARVHGPERLRAALGRYARQHRFGHPGPEDLLQAIRDELGERAAEQLRQGLFEPSGVDYAVEQAASLEADGGWRGRVSLRRRGELSFAVDVLLLAEDGSSKRLYWDARSDAATLEAPLQAPLAAAIVDPDYRVLLDENLSNNARRAGVPSGKARLAPAVLTGAALGAQLWFTLAGL